MIPAGNVTVYLTDMDRAVDFYTNVLSLTPGQRFSNHWAEIHVGQTLVIGLHPRSSHGPAPGASGSMSIGLNPDEPIDQARQHKGSARTACSSAAHQHETSRPDSPLPPSAARTATTSTCARC